MIGRLKLIKNHVWDPEMEKMKNIEKNSETKHFKKYGNEDKIINGIFYSDLFGTPKNQNIRSWR